MAKHRIVIPTDSLGPWDDDAFAFGVSIVRVTHDPFRAACFRSATRTRMAQGSVAEHPYADGHFPIIPVHHSTMLVYDTSRRNDFLETVVWFLDAIADHRPSTRWIG